MTVGTLRYAWIRSATLLCNAREFDQGQGHLKFKPRKNKSNVCVRHNRDLIWNEALPVAMLQMFRWEQHAYKSARASNTCRAVSAAQIAGVPKPCVVELKWVRGRWTELSRMGWGRVFPIGDRSCAIRSWISFTICLKVLKQVTKISCIKHARYNNIAHYGSFRGGKMTATCTQQLRLGALKMFLKISGG